MCPTQGSAALALAAWSAPWQSPSSTGASLTPQTQASCQTPSSGCGRQTCTAASTAVTLVGVCSSSTAGRWIKLSVEQRRDCVSAGAGVCLPPPLHFWRSPASVAVGCRTHADTCGHAPECVSLCLPLPLFHPTPDPPTHPHPTLPAEVYDTEGRFVPEKFEEIFSKYDRENKGGLSW